LTLRVHTSGRQGQPWPPREHHSSPSRIDITYERTPCTSPAKKPSTALQPWALCYASYTHGYLQCLPRGCLATEQLCGRTDSDNDPERGGAQRKVQGVAPDKGQRHRNSQCHLRCDSTRVTQYCCVDKRLRSACQCAEVRLKPSHLECQTQVVHAVTQGCAAHKLPCAFAAGCHSSRETTRQVICLPFCGSHHTCVLSLRFKRLDDFFSGSAPSQVPHRCKQLALCTPFKYKCAWATWASHDA